jgi:hypothetical protein
MCHTQGLIISVLLTRRLCKTLRLNNRSELCHNIIETMASRNLRETAGRAWVAGYLLRLSMSRTTPGSSCA